MGTNKRQSSFQTFRIKYVIQTLRITRHRNVHSGHVVLISSHLSLSLSVSLSLSLCIIQTLQGLYEDLYRYLGFREYSVYGSWYWKNHIETCMKMRWNLRLCNIPPNPKVLPCTSPELQTITSKALEVSVP